MVGAGEDDILAQMTAPLRPMFAPLAGRRGPALSALATAAFAAALLAACVGPNQGGQGGPYRDTAPPPASPPPPMAMDASRSLGLWQSSFGAVKIESDATQGPGGIMGVWLYERTGQEVVGFFTGTMDGNVLEFSWHEPSQPDDLIGAGYLVFDPSGQSFGGKWWTDDQSRLGDWDGWRVQQTPAPNASTASGADGHAAASPQY